MVRLAKHDRLASVQVLVLRADELPLVLSEVGVPVVNDRWEFLAAMSKMLEPDAERSAKRVTSRRRNSSSSPARSPIEVSGGWRK